MKAKRTRKFVGILLAASLLGNTGCPPDEYDWTWAVPSIIAAFFAGQATGGGSQTTIIERFCFENGQPVDCSQIPFVP
ncbi:MAG: hypothetical protein LC135_00530 [Phycisphaerae bacterium]|jgi:hypothetical protein|nr:hypothetical protein [Phycisphaerae bacterium]MCZ2398337.1 hypothetical protein [Phycisphaerae bacterium]